MYAFLSLLSITSLLASSVRFQFDMTPRIKCEELKQEIQSTSIATYALLKRIDTFIATYPTLIHHAYEVIRELIDKKLDITEEAFYSDHTEILFEPPLYNLSKILKNTTLMQEIHVLSANQ